MTPALSADDQRAFESEVLAYFRSAFHEYCERAHRTPGLDLRGTVIEAQLVTASALQLVTVEIRRQADIFAGRLVRARAVDVRFPVQPRLGAPGYRLEVTPPIPGSEQTRPPQQRRPDSGRTLRLSYGSSLRWDFPLVSGPDWVPLGRSIPAQRGSGYLIPETVQAVPRGVLLEVRHQLGDTEVCRSEQRPEYIVEVDGLRLEPGYLVTAGETGSIVFSRADSAVSTRLTYRVDRRV
ncbi:hypothetical protein [Actinoplanes friuliensis]|jgi:hypothetical protein|uniref:Uncharacterized protein n=1 Tax=Actinoplanes friuliensis DSM 7358 TaxID=1246995 RepID=U5W0T3_9ACTN|nr:hypothetical protein [Actinoplanes friuliensis]AGZ41550.1 hypothetical protein AFR_16340 [Actinoplanes friuliensis DSM 7358]